MVAGKDVCLRRLAKGRRAQEVRFNRFLGNDKVTVARVIESWSEGTAVAAEGRHVLAIQDTSEINFATTARRRRGLGEIGKGNGRGVLLHPMLAVDAENGVCLGLLSGQVWTRGARRTVSHDRRDLPDKESQRWISTALAAKPLLAGATMVTSLGDRESDIFAVYASVPDERFHVIARSMHDRKLACDTGLYAASEQMPVVEQAWIVLPSRAQRPERPAHLELRFGAVRLARPKTKFLRHLPESVPVTLVDVREPHPQADTEPLHWRLLTTHPVASAQDAWRIVEWYKRRWLIEQFFRVLKTQGLKLEDSQTPPPTASSSSSPSRPKQQSSPSNSCRRATAAANNRCGLCSMPTRSQPSPPSTKSSRPTAKRSKIRIRQTPWPGPPGSSAGSAAGMAIRLQSRQAPSRSSTAWNTSTPLPQDGASKMCACPSAKAGTRGQSPRLPVQSD
jgi:hypothetical protein